MQNFENGTEPVTKAGALEDDQLPVTTMTINDDNNDSNSKAGRNDNDNDKSTTNDAMTFMAIPAGRNDMGNAMAATDNATDNATSATSTMNTTSVAPTVRHVSSVTNQYSD